MPEWLLGSRIKAQGEEGRGWGTAVAAAAAAGAASAGPQAGGFLFAFFCIVDLRNVRSMMVLMMFCCDIAAESKV